ncbi:MAG: YraN family protein [Terriglobales bacterium]
MFSARITQMLLRGLDRLAARKLAAQKTPAHLRTGRRGEEDAYFYLRKKGYVMIARNFRTARHRGEIDLIGWSKDRGEDVLCFIEVKTRTTRDVKPAHAAVDRKKRRDLRAVIRDYLYSLPRRQFPESPLWRFDVVTVYYDGILGEPTFELFRNAALSS